ncbi:hypothetical protein IBL26_12180 [Roseomonas aerophila]|uniref:Uncharacterized protein n=1 Tax=Teichococcus aerophilus TaxID=1224513 RepID=A0ABR7RMH8_9PROT|nr:hypothetical protein [Pseudoroseomonas aerophila]MBC9207593.1 hypothetical protein [Pseudoroseomonas aerophila]
MTRNARTLLAATALLSLSAFGASAQEPFRVTGRGENFAVEYAPGYTGNIVGGGAAPHVASGDTTQADYAHPVYEHAAPGIPTFRGGREGDVVYLPAPATSLQASMDTQG